MRLDADTAVILYRYTTEKRESDRFLQYIHASQYKVKYKVIHSDTASTSIAANFTN